MTEEEIKQTIDSEHYSNCSSVQIINAECMANNTKPNQHRQQKNLVCHLFCIFFFISSFFVFSFLHRALIISLEIETACDESGTTIIMRAQKNKRQTKKERKKKTSILKNFFFFALVLLSSPLTYSILNSKFREYNL